MAYGRLNTDGTLSSASKQHNGFVSISLFETKEDGSYYTYYKEIDGKYIVDTVKEQEAKDIAEANTIKEDKQKKLDTLIVTTNTVPFDADNQSINYMSSVLSIANFKYNQSIASGNAPATTYEFIYKTVIQWKNADNTVSDVQLETVAEALEQAMLEVGEIKTND